MDKDAAIKNREEIVDELCEYIDDEVAKGVILHSITRHILGLYQGCRGARAWRRHLSENAHGTDSDSSVVRDALKYVV
jgi:tRNA-dihydrouridine synthase A